MVLPAKWAKIYVATLSVYEGIYRSPTVDGNNWIFIESVEIYMNVGM